MRWKPLVASLVTALSFAALPSGMASSATSSFAPGDIFVGVSSSKVQWRLADGTLNATMATAISSDTTGMAFDPSGRLYVSGYSSNYINRFSTSGGPDGTFGPKVNSDPESIAFDRTGNAFVPEEHGDKKLLRLNPSGVLTGTFAVAGEGDKGPGRVDVAGDQCTIYYTAEGKAVKRYNVCTATQLADLTSSLTGKKAFDVRILPGGDVVVADTQAIYRLNSSGAIVKTYDKAGDDCWWALAVDAGGSAIWAGDNCSSDIVKFDLATGAVLKSFSTGTKSGTVEGIGVSGGYAAAGEGADLSVSTTDSPDPVGGGNQVTYTSTVANAGPSAASAVALAGSISGGTVLSASGSGWTCSTTSSAATCALAGTLAAGSSAAPVNVVVSTPDSDQDATASSSSTVSSSTFDPNTGNNTSTQSTAVRPLADLSISTQDSPDPVGGGSDVRYRSTVTNNGPHQATGVTVADSVSAGFVDVTAGSSWSCSASGGSSVTCTLGVPLASGASAPPLDIYVRAPEQSSSFTLTNTATASASQLDANSGNSTASTNTTVSPAEVGSSSGYIPPSGGSVTTDPGTGAISTDSTVATATFPAGPGGIASLIEDPNMIVFCQVSGNPKPAGCFGSAVDVIVPNGYINPANPIQVLITHDVTVVPSGQDVYPTYMEKPVGNATPTLLLDCSLQGGPTTSLPCVQSHIRLPDGDYQVLIYMLSGDPKFQP